MEREQIIALYILYRRLKKRLQCINPINQVRKEYGDLCIIRSTEGNIFMRECIHPKQILAVTIR